MLSNTSKYAIRAILYLAKNNEQNAKVGIKKIAKELDIPTPFLGKILQLLAKNKILLSTKGPNGGFSLAHDASEITLYDIVNVIDGDDLFSNCLISSKSCNETGHQCPMHKTYERIREDIKNMFMNQNLNDLVKHINDNEGLVML